MKYRKLPVEIEAITFEKLVEEKPKEKVASVKKNKKTIKA